MQATNISVTQQNPLTQKPNLREGSSIFENYAHNFHEAGFKVIPVLEKLPIIPFKQWIDYEQTSEAIDCIIGHIKKNNFGQDIGIAILGTHEVCVVDVDIDNKEIQDLVPSTPYICRGKKGAKYFFRHQGLRNRPGSIHPVELLAHGRYFVVPPSLWGTKEDGTYIRYNWIGSSLEGIEYIKSIQDLPPLTEKDFDRLIEYCRRMKIMTRSRVNGFVKVGNRAEPVEGRNNILFAALCARIEDKAAECDEFTGKEESELAEWLVGYDKKLFPSNPWLTTDEGNKRHQGDAYAAALAFVHREVTRLKPKLVIGDQSKIVLPEHIKTTEEVLISKDNYNDNSDENAGLSSNEMFDKFNPTDEEWETVIPRSGILRDCYEKYSERAINKIPQFGLAVGLSIQSIAASNIIESYFNFKDKNSPDVSRITTSPNLYIMCIAPTGHGKNAVKSAITSTLGTTPAGRKMVQGSIVSARGFMMSHEISPKRSVLFCLDEGGKIFESAESEKIITALMEGYTADKDFSGGANAGDARFNQKQIAGYKPTVVAISTAEGLAKSITAKNSEKGLFNRWLFMVSNRRVKTFAESLEALDENYDTVDELQHERIDIPGVENAEHYVDHSIHTSRSYFSANDVMDLTERINPALRMLLDAQMKIDPHFKAGPDEDKNLVCPVLCSNLLVKSPKVLKHYSKLIKRYDNPALFFMEMWVKVGNKPFNMAALTRDDQTHSQLKIIMARASQVINKLAFHYAINDPSVVANILKASEVPGSGNFKVIGEYHYDMAAKVYELSLRSFLSVLGPRLFSSDFCQVGVRGGVADSVNERNMMELERYWVGEVQMFNITRRGFRKRLENLWGKDYKPEMCAQALRTWRDHGKPIKFKDK